MGEVLAPENVALTGQAAGRRGKMPGGHVVDVNVVHAALGIDEGDPAGRLEDDRSADPVEIAGAEHDAWIDDDDFELAAGPLERRLLRTIFGVAVDESVRRQIEAVAFCEQLPRRRG